MPRLSLSSPSGGKRAFLRRIFSLQRPPPPTPLIVTTNLERSTSSTVQDTGNRDATSGETRAEPSPGAGNAAGSQTANSTSPGGRVVGNLLTDSPSSVSTSSGILNGAHDLLIQNSTFNVVYNMNKSHDPVFVESFLRNIDGGGTVLLVLDRKRVSGAEMDSSDREPPPRCHPETRIEIRETLNTWLSSLRKTSSFVWLSGPAGAGKSAVAQTFAEHAHGLGKFGASFFFSRLQHRDSPAGVVATIAYQLALRDAGYNNLITDILFNDPSILDKTMRLQFQKLIVEPFAILAAQNATSAAPRQPLLVIIDGLDECSSESAQCEIITLIGEYVRLSSKPCPLVWLLCSRPEWHIKRTFAYADPPIDCNREEITCNAAEDVKDVYRILRDGLQEIRNKTNWDLQPSQLRVQWPTETKLQRLSVKIGGLPVFASTVLRFIGDESGTPDAQLDFCLLCLETMREPSEINPLEALDIFYHHIMLRVPQSILSTTKQILAFSILSSSYTIPRGDKFIYVFEAGRLLQISKDTFYFSLRNLHSVVDVPSSDLADRRPLRFFHKSFPDFLQQTSRSGMFAPNMDQARYEIASLSVRWQNHLINWKCKLAECHTPAPDMSLTTDPRWITDAEAMGWKQSEDRFQEIVEFNWCNMCTSLSGDFKSRIMQDLAVFNFCHFQLTDYGSLASGTRMVNLMSQLWETSIPDPPSEPEAAIVRPRPSSSIDESFTQSFSAPLPLLDSLSQVFVDGMSRRTLWFTSSHQSRRIYSSGRNEVLAAIWIGKGERAALAWLTKG